MFLHIAGPFESDALPGIKVGIVYIFFERIRPRVFRAPSARIFFVGTGGGISPGSSLLRKNEHLARALTERSFGVSPLRKGCTFSLPLNITGTNYLYLTNSCDRQKGYMYLHFFSLKMGPYFRLGPPLQGWGPPRNLPPPLRKNPGSAPGQGKG